MCSTKINVSCNGFSGAPAEDGRVRVGETCLFESPERVEALLCLLHNGQGVGGGGQVAPQELDGTDLLHSGVTNGQQCMMLGAGSPEVDHHLFC